MAIGQPDILPLRGTVADMLAQKSPVVHAVSPETSALDAIAQMDAKRVGALLVMQGERLVGILSERDYTRKVILLGRASKDTPVAEIMTRQVIVVPPQMGLGECLQVVTDHGIRHLPVVEDGRVIGVLSIGDLVRAVVTQQRDTITSPNSFRGSDYPA